MKQSSCFIDACYGRSTTYTPVWLMRQAGRYQSSYRELRQRVSFFELCQTPELAAQVTIQAVHDLGVDAAIIFSDILVPVKAMGMDVDLTDKGPVLAKPVRDARDVEALRVVDPVETMGFVGDAIRLVNKAFDGKLPVIGFAGAPLTLAAYLVEGKHSKDFSSLKQLMYASPQLAHQLFDRLSQMVLLHLRAQIEAGCHAIQLFDSWAGILGPDDYATFALPYVQRIFDGLKNLNVPRIIFGTNTATLIELLDQSGADVVGIDWRLPLDQARARLKNAKAMQGNLDPCCLFCPDEELVRRVKQIFSQVGDRRGFIFNLGHGVLPETDVAKARFLVETVHQLSRQS